jgi:hypothetical protein
MELYAITTQAHLRSQFWEAHPQFKRQGNRRQNDYNATIRSAWVEYVDYLAKAGGISEALADRATL